MNVVAGSINLGGSEINGKNIKLSVGFLNVSGSNFSHQAILNSPDISLNDTKTQDIFVNSEDANKKLIVILKGKSVVSGNIKFNNNHGLVCLENTARLDGQVIGGNLHNGKCVFDNLD